MSDLRDYTAALLIIGNEILSGRTADKNINFIAKNLAEMGIRFLEVRVVPDDETAIISAANVLRKNYTYLFTTGGIGPTHDDITSSCIAKAFNVNLKRHHEALKMLKSHYSPPDLNEARLKMADIPEGAKLIENPVSKAPGFIIENVYVMAGVPIIMQAMFDSIKSTLKTGIPQKSKTISTNLTEGIIATELGKIQLQHKDTDIGSYPFIKNGKLGVSLVVRSTDENKINNVCEDIKNLIKKNDGNLLEAEE